MKSVYKVQWLACSRAQQSVAIIITVSFTYNDGFNYHLYIKDFLTLKKFATSNSVFPKPIYHNLFNLLLFLCFHLPKPPGSKSKNQLRCFPYLISLREKKMWTYQRPGRQSCSWWLDVRVLFYRTPYFWNLIQKFSLRGYNMPGTVLRNWNSIVNKTNSRGSCGTHFLV